MADPVKVLAFAGSARKESLNRRLLAIAVTATRQAGGEVTAVELAGFAMPLYNGDDHAAHGFPEGVMRLKRLFLDHHALLIASTEHNSALSALLKNAIDWVSRSAPGEKSLEAFRGKTAALLSASPGALGGLRGLASLRSILTNIGTLVLPDQVAVPKADTVLRPDGSIPDEAIRARIASLAAALVTTTAKLRA